MSYKIVSFWTEGNPLTERRLHSLSKITEISECTHELITKDNLHSYILPEAPLHPAYEYLSAVHKSDYLRTYFMNFYGGAYTDIKHPTGSWTQAYAKLMNSDKWMSGYKEFPLGGVCVPELEKYWYDLIGTGCFICKQHTPLTEEWYGNMISLLDTKLEALKKNPATHTRDHYEINHNYPIGWNEMLGRIFHKLNYKYKDHISQDLPPPVCTNYQ
jgi:hypothetical protein